MPTLGVCTPHPPLSQTASVGDFSSASTTFQLNVSTRTLGKNRTIKYETFIL